jgi:hypothetical protein
VVAQGDDVRPVRLQELHAGVVVRLQRVHLFFLAGPDADGPEVPDVTEEELVLRPVVGHERRKQFRSGCIPAVAVIIRHGDK